MVNEAGPIEAGDATPVRRRAGDPDPDPSTGRMWNWQDGKIALEWLFSQGRVSTASRRNFIRSYDLTERVIPADVLDQPIPAEADACRALMRRTAGTCGNATATELRNYFQLPADLATAAINELVDSTELIKIRIDGVPGVRYRWHHRCRKDHGCRRIGGRTALAGRLVGTGADRPRTTRQPGR